MQKAFHLPEDIPALVPIGEYRRRQGEDLKRRVKVDIRFQVFLEHLLPVSIDELVNNFAVQSTLLNIICFVANYDSLNSFLEN